MKTKMKRKLINSLRLLLVAALLGVGQSAWGETHNPTIKMTYINGTAANADDSYGEVTTAYCGYNNISKGTVGLANSGWGVNNIAYLQVDASALPDGATITAASLTMDCQKISARNLSYGVGYHSAAWSSTMTWNTADRSITTMGALQSVSKQNGEESKTFDIVAAFSGDDDNIVTILVYQTAAGGGYVKNPSVTITYTTETAYSVTFAETNSVAATVKIGGSDVTSGTLLANGTYDFTATATGYQDYAGSFTVSGADKEVTFTMTAKAVYNYTVKGVDGSSNDLGNVASGWVYEGDAASVAYPRWILKGTTLYSSGSGAVTYSTSFTPNADGYVKEITYNSGTVSNVVFYTEGEDVSGASVGSNTRASKGNMGYTASATTYKNATTLSPGKYQICMRGQNGNSAARTYNFKVGESVVFTGSITNGTNMDANSEEFTVYETSTLSFACEGSSSSGIDYFYVVKTGDATVSKTVTSAGWATYCSPYALDFSSAITNLNAAYLVVGGAGGYVTKSEITTTIPANTGILLRGEGEVTIPVVASSATDVSANKLVGVTANTLIAANAGYVLMNEEGGIGFYQNENEFTVGANTAYLPVGFDGGTARSFFSLWNDDETTSISEKVKVNSDKFATAPVFNLNGQRVEKPAKGLYIVNGKKVVMK